MGASYEELVNGYSGEKSHSSEGLCFGEGDDFWSSPPLPLNQFNFDSRILVNSMQLPQNSLSSSSSLMP